MILSDKLDKTKRGWWKKAVFYQIYPKSFQDTDDDGIGNIKGITEHLDYLENLGIDGIWLSPVCRSPQADNGYDISDYCDIDSLFGNMEDMVNLINEAEKHGISIIMDLVLNHSSNEHYWFKEALKGNDNPYHDFYVWRDGTPDNPPNDMKSVFGGSAWEYVPDLKKYYFHQFLPEQPDLNWDNPKLREELYKTIRFWVDKGVDGFRLDVIDQIAKEPDKKVTANGTHLHEYLKELSEKAFVEDGIVTVGEAWSADIERARQFSNPDGSELSMVFQFQHICLDNKEGGEKWDVIKLPLKKLKKCMAEWQNGLFNCGWNSLFLNNHDLPRIVSRWGNDGAYRTESAKMLGTMLHGMQGTPYIYQGEELGMTNIRLDISEYVDPEIKNIYKERIDKGFSPEEVMQSIHLRGRDNARTPMQWSNEKYAGFSTVKPWLPVNPNYIEINAESQINDENSVFSYYRKLILLRKTYKVFIDGNFELFDDENDKIFSYIRRNQNEKMIVICNFTDENINFDIPEEFRDAEVLIENYRGNSKNLRSYEARILYKKNTDNNKEE